jgi:threonine/homoserine/homoserine lactone efflux protein
MDRGGVMSASSFLTYLLASVLVALAPGPGMLFVISRGLEGGRRAGVVAALGTSSGIGLHIAAAAFGVSVALEASELGFHLLKWAGVAYLLYLAWCAIRGSSSSARRPRTGSRAITSVFWQGALVNALNPKVALFFVAFLPQFVPAGGPSLAVHMAVLGAVFMLVTVAVFTLYGWFAGGGRAWLMEHTTARVLLDRLTALLFVYLGLRLALARRAPIRSHPPRQFPP